MPSQKISNDPISPEHLLQTLIRFDTTNPPGNEKPCVDYINGLLTDSGFSPKIFAKHPDRPNLIARLKGRQQAPPLLIYGHVDVVTTEDQTWQYPPFEGRMVNGYIWGRGALDMKGGVAMMLAAFLRAKATGLTPAGDILLAILSDEEAGGDAGARYLVENHAEEFAGVRFAIGEFGGCSMYIGNKKFYPIQVSEKQACWMRATVRGPGGHGAMPIQGGAMAKLGRLLTQLDHISLAPHITPILRRMIETIAAAMPLPNRLILRQLLNPGLTAAVLKLLGERGKNFRPLLYHTVNPTLVKGGDKINVIPSKIDLQLDGRILPGFSPSDFISELRRVIDKDVELEITHHDPGPSRLDMGMFDFLAGVLKEADPAGIPLPMLLPGITDGRFFSRLNIQTYGFTPMNLPSDFNFFTTIHGADERIPVDAIRFGADAIHRVLERYAGPAQ